MRKKLIAWYYTAGVASEGGVTAFAAAYNKTKKLGLSFAVGILGLFSRGAAARYFQGESILASARAPSSEPALPVVSEEPNQLNAPLLAPENNVSEPVAESKSSRSSTSSILLQTGYVLSDGFNCLLSRYFIFNACFVAFARDPNGWVFGSTVILDFVIAQLFALLTATYAATGALADNNAKPFYANALKPFTGEHARTLVRYVGSAEFIIANYLIGWVTLARSIVNDLTEDESVRDGTTIAVTALSSLVGLVLFCQTYLFDGRYMHQNLDKVKSQTGNITARPLPNWLLKLTDKTLYIAGPTSAISSGVSIVIGLSQDTPPPAKWIIAGIAGLLDAVGVWKGAELSQVREAREELKKMRREQDIAAVTGAIINSESVESVAVVSGQALA
jgi:hypothetical protein